MKKIISPIYVLLQRKTKPPRKIGLNLNVYRNLHFQVNNILKVKYNELMREQLNNLNFPHPIQLEFVLYKPNKRKIDRSNILCIVEKFFCDSLTHYGCIPDDNDNHIIGTRYRTAGIDRENPRVEVLISDRRSGSTL